MALEVQFAFLGPEHSYVATVTKVSSGRPQDVPNAAFYGLPKDFCDAHMRRLRNKRYIFNVRGHDFISFVGQWRSVDGEGALDTNSNLYNEINELQKFAKEDEDKRKRRANLIACFGPSSGSFFADAVLLRRYRWSILPPDLEDEVQKVVCANGWVEKGKGKIFDIAINSLGGWVMQFDEGKDYKYGGSLHESLEHALEQGRMRKGATIARLFLNHQHPTEYVLLFTDGIAYARLHEEFKFPLRGLLLPWSQARINKKRQPEEWYNFSASCKCRQEEQRKVNADYYQRRGLFHHLRGSHQLAFEYLREANAQHPQHLSIQSDYVMALKTLRFSRNDPVLEEDLLPAGELSRQITGLSGPFHGGPTESENRRNFRHEYLKVISRLKKVGGERAQQLVTELEERSARNNEVLLRPRLENGWSNAMAESLEEPRVRELAVTNDAEHQGDPARNIQELSA